MSEKITLPRLAALLGERSGLAPKLCEDYLRVLFETVSGALANGENVRISGLGTFKLVRVMERRSVDVTTGEPMVISAHSKVSFVPSKELAALANSPFAMFEAVEVSDQVGSSELEEAAAPGQDIEAQSADVAGKPNVESAQEEADEEPEIDRLNIQEACGFSPTVYSYTIEDDETIDVTGAGEALKDYPPDESVDEDGAENLPVLYQGSYDDVERLKRRRFGYGFMAGFVSALAMLALLVCAWVWWHNSRSGSGTEVTDIITDDTAVVTGPDSIMARAPEAVSQPVESGEPEMVVETQPSDEPVYDYVSTTRYLTTIAKEHYGNYNLWPYIYEENQSRLGHPDRIKPGTRVVVPPLAKYGVNPEDPSAIAEAKRKGAEIYSRYR